MIKILAHIFKLRLYREEEDGMAATEVALLFPVLLALMMGIYDVGQGVVVNQKTVTASQVIGDLITRNEVVDTELLTDIITAGELSLAPYGTEDFGYDIASVEFDEDEDPVVLWRLTNNMNEDDDLLDSAVGLGTTGEGVVMVSITNRYIPFFANFVVNSIDMNEVAYLRGRKSAIVACSDC